MSRTPTPFTGPLSPYAAEIERIRAAGRAAHATGGIGALHAALRPLFAMVRGLGLEDGRKSEAARERGRPLRRRQLEAKEND